MGGGRAALRPRHGVADRVCGVCGAAAVILGQSHQHRRAHLLKLSHRQHVEVSKLVKARPLDNMEFMQVRSTGSVMVVHLCGKTNSGCCCLLFEIIPGGRCPACQPHAPRSPCSG